MTAVALLFGGLHTAAMGADTAASAVANAAVNSTGNETGNAPCHQADQATAQAPEKPACCPGDCSGTCTPVAAFFAAPEGAQIGFEPVSSRLLLMAAAPSSRETADERPPKTSA